jgi:PKHD-type hydroxylase
MNYHLNKIPQYSYGHIPTYSYFTEAFSNEEIKKIIEIGERQELKESQVHTGDQLNTLVMDPKRRISEISWIEFQSDTKWLYEKLEHYVNYLNDMYYNFDLTNYEQLQYTCYNKEGSHYDWHSDAPYSIMKPLSRKLSLSLFLSDRNEYSGGDFEYNGSGIVQKVNEQEKGTLIIFPSFLIHRVTPVTKGVRKSLVMWIQGPHFK